MVDACDSVSARLPGDLGRCAGWKLTSLERSHMTRTSPTALVISAARVWVRERRQRTRLAEALGVAVALAAMLTIAPTSAQAASVPATARDLIVTGGGDDGGYHLFQAT